MTTIGMTNPTNDTRGLESTVEFTGEFGRISVTCDNGPDQAVRIGQCGVGASQRDVVLLTYADWQRIAHEVETFHTHAAAVVSGEASLEAIT